MRCVGNWEYFQQEGKTVDLNFISRSVRVPFSHFSVSEGMASFAGSLNLQLSIRLRSRYLLIPWVKSVSAISCCGAYQSSGLVRCIGRNFSSSEGQNSSHRSSGSSLLINTTTQRSLLLDDEAQYTERISNTENGFIDDDMNCDLGVEDHGCMEELKIGKPIGEFTISFQTDASKMDAPIARTAKQDVEVVAIQILAKRATTTVELRKKLSGKKFPSDKIEAVIDNLRGRGMLDDYLYAETYSRSRWQSLSWGPRRIKQALFQKGVSAVDAEKAMKHVFEDGNSGADQDSHLGMSKTSVDHLLVQASKQWLRGRDVPLETRKTRIVRWLQYRGFDWRVTNFVLKKLESQYSL